MGICFGHQTKEKIVGGVVGQNRNSSSITAIYKVNLHQEVIGSYLFLHPLNQIDAIYDSNTRIVSTPEILKVLRYGAALAKLKYKAWFLKIKKSEQLDFKAKLVTIFSCRKLTATVM